MNDKPMMTRLKKGLAKNRIKHAGMTMVEMIVTFALLSLFMLAATRVISYTVTIYYVAKGNANGLQVSNMISSKVVGMIEGAITDPEVTIVSGSDYDSIYFTNDLESTVNITADTLPGTTDNKNYINIHYDAVDTGANKYDEVDWRFDSKAYLGYTVSELHFENPGSDYPENVIKMTITLHSDRYGDYNSKYYIKAVNITKFNYITS